MDGDASRMIAEIKTAIEMVFLLEMKWKGGWKQR